MSPVKENAIRLIQSLPDDCSVEDSHYHLYIRGKVEQGLTAIDDGHVVSLEEAEMRMTEWAKSSGPSPL